MMRTLFPAAQEQVDTWIEALRGKKTVVVAPDAETAWAVGERLADFGVGMVVDVHGSSLVRQWFLADSELEALVVPKGVFGDADASPWDVGAVHGGFRPAGACVVVSGAHAGAAP
ncbi:MAG: hypothetical protein IRZ33_06040 [Alicyclobacillaceae bacterium]|nr:hypothetical protein [Alicyclobacillaceae bacterium]